MFKIKKIVKLTVTFRFKKNKLYNVYNIMIIIQIRNLVI